MSGETFREVLGQLAEVGVTVLVFAILAGLKILAGYLKARTASSKLAWIGAAAEAAVGSRMAAAEALKKEGTGTLTCQDAADLFESAKADIAAWAAANGVKIAGEAIDGAVDAAIETAVWKLKGTAVKKPSSEVTR
jgi:hypothetical protein